MTPSSNFLVNHKIFAHFSCLFILGGASGKEPTYQHRRYKTQFLSLGWEDPLGKKMATHSSILAWRILWTKEPGRLKSVELQSWTWLSNLACTLSHKLIPDTFPLFKKKNSSNRLNEKTAKIKWPKLWSSRNSYSKNFGWYPNLYDPE